MLTPKESSENDSGADEVLANALVSDNDDSFEDCKNEGNTMKAGAFVACKYSSFRSVAPYVGQVENIANGGLKINILKHCRDLFVWPNVKDEGEVSRDNIQSVLPKSEH